MTDDELTDAWETGEVFAGGITHQHHVRIAWVLRQRHGRDEARRRLLVGTQRACERHGCPEKFDVELTKRWAGAVFDAADRDGRGSSAAEFMAAHPALADGSHFGGLADVQPNR